MVRSHFVLKTSPAGVLLRKAAGIDKGSGVPNREKVGKVTRGQIREIAELKFKDMNANDIECCHETNRRHRPQYGPEYC